MAADVAKVDEEAINAVKEQLSSAVGEAMLVRIEVDRFIAAQEEKFDATAVRMSEIEAQLADTMDVSEAVQLERLEEIERALLELDPNQFVRKVDASSEAGSRHRAPIHRCRRAARIHHRSPATRRTDAELVTPPLAGDGHYGTVPENERFT